MNKDRNLKIHSQLIYTMSYIFYVHSNLTGGRLHCLNWHLKHVLLLDVFKKKKFFNTWHRTAMFKNLVIKPTIKLQNKFGLKTFMPKCGKSPGAESAPETNLICFYHLIFLKFFCRDSIYQALKLWSFIKIHSAV